MTKEELLELVIATKGPVMVILRGLPGSGKSTLQDVWGRRRRGLEDLFAPMTMTP
jgi:putative protein kinase ArgK-like GTPase of G3E family